jgi:hypothetical protein
MRTMIFALFMTLFMAIMTIPAAAQQPVRGQEAIAIVQGGDIRASSSEGVQSLLLLVDYRGTQFTCIVTAVGQVQTCHPLHW